MIDRKADLTLVRTALKRSRIVALLGPRQCGKTTIARQFVDVESLNYFDLEDPQSLARGLRDYTGGRLGMCGYMSFLWGLFVRARRRPRHGSHLLRPRWCGSRLASGCVRG